MTTLVDYLQKTGIINVFVMVEYKPSKEIKEGFVIADKCISEIQFSVNTTKKMERYNSVIWKGNYVSISKTTFKGIAEDSISYYFGGCLMARLRSKSDGTYRIAHIHCGEGNIESVSSFCDYVTSSCKEESTSFDELIIFKPLPVSYFSDAFKAVDIYSNFEVWGIIDNAGKCFSVLVYKLNSYNECCVLIVVEHINSHSMALDKIKDVSDLYLIKYVNNEFRDLKFNVNFLNAKIVEKIIDHSLNIMQTN